MTREEALRWLKDFKNCSWDGMPEEALDVAIQTLEQEPKTGHWIAVENDEMEIVGYYCSECDLPMETEKRTDFCPNCGADMREGDE